MQRVDMYISRSSSSPVRTPKLQLAAEQLSTGECWIPPKKDTPHPRAKEKPQQEGRRGKITFRIKPQTHQNAQGLKQNLVQPEDPTETVRPALEHLSISCRGTGQQWPAAGTGTLGVADLGVA